VFHGSGYSQLVKLFKDTFRIVKPVKPKASRDKSSETFLVGMGLKKRLSPTHTHCRWQRASRCQGAKPAFSLGPALGKYALFALETPKMGALCTSAFVHYTGLESFEQSVVFQRLPSGW
jgi:hypothetical protein